MPLFSVIIPFHNAADTLASTLKSLRDQSFSDWEAICIDDGGTDCSSVIASAFAAADSRIHLRKTAGKGPSDARNTGARMAAGTYLAFLDADDLWSPDKLATLAAAFAVDGPDALYARVGFFQDNPLHSQTISTIIDRPLQIRDLLAENPVCTLSNLTINAAVFRSVEGFNTDISHNEDLDLLIRVVGEGYRVEGLDTLLTWYRNSSQGLSSNIPAMLESRRRVAATAAGYGVYPTRAEDAVYLRYLARRALRLRAPHKEAWAYTIEGLRRHPVQFLTPLRRGAATAAASALVRCVPAATRLVRS